LQEAYLLNYHTIALSSGIRVSLAFFTDEDRIFYLRWLKEYFRIKGSVNYGYDKVFLLTAVDRTRINNETMGLPIEMTLRATVPLLYRSRRHYSRLPRVIYDYLLTKD
jgi:hypothetical protein